MSFNALACFPACGEAYRELSGCGDWDGVFVAREAPEEISDSTVRTGAVPELMSLMMFHIRSPVYCSMFMSNL